MGRREIHIKMDGGNKTVEHFISQAELMDGL